MSVQLTDYEPRFEASPWREQRFSKSSASFCSSNENIMDRWMDSIIQRYADISKNDAEAKGIHYFETWCTPVPQSGFGQIWSIFQKKLMDGLVIKC